MSIVTDETLAQSDLINWTIFSEILMMDEDEEGFALSLVETFVQQAYETFLEIESMLFTNVKSEEGLKQLSAKGHYLKGSAAALGLQKVQNECERIQNYGKMENFDNYSLASNAVSVDDWYKCCEQAYNEVKIWFDESKILLSSYFNHQL
ncbi:Ypd1 protein [Martiniozyma asiatica (nom. inval.)]|nr:Ypd1 protein [Martiniozyma asiatica]